MSPREKLQLAYELAFHPIRFHEVRAQLKRGGVSDLAEVREVLDWAAALHQRLPEAPAVTGRALRRLAGYQAESRLFRMATAITRFREALGCSAAVPVEVPAWMVRDIALPPLARRPSPTTTQPANHDFS